MIDRMALAAALAGVLTFGGPVQDSSAADPPAAAWLQADPADSLYRAARQALDRRDYTHAAELFARVPARFPQSAYAGDAYYWNAFALYRIGGTSQLHAALDALDAQRGSHPRAATRGDAQALERRIEGELARRGGPRSALAGLLGLDAHRQPRSHRHRPRVLARLLRPLPGRVVPGGRLRLLLQHRPMIS